MDIETFDSLYRTGAATFVFAAYMSACNANTSVNNVSAELKIAQSEIVELKDGLRKKEFRPSHVSLLETHADIIGGPGKDSFTYNADGTITLIEIDGDAPKNCPAYTRDILGSPKMDVYEQCSDGTITILEIDGKLPVNYDPAKTKAYARPQLPFRITSGQKSNTNHRGD